MDAACSSAGVYAPSHRVADKCSLGRPQSIRQHLLAQGVAATQPAPSTQRFKKATLPWFHLVPL